ncbi:MAG: hypothetical protein JW795_01890 [Chitinivibrionales bacterium]|nr:hypothetical protein [Chitinivibrionales bacterium]
MKQNIVTVTVMNLLVMSFLLFAPNLHSSVLVGYWETWDGPEVHPPVGHVPLNTINGYYNILNVAFPIVLPDGTCVLNDSIVDGEQPPTPREVAQAQASGRKVLLSVGGADGGLNLNSEAVAAKFVETTVKVIEYYGFDGIDIDIETGLIAGTSMSDLTPSQKNLITICDKICTHFRSRSRPDFLLTLTPETAYVTGGSVQFGTVYGSYLPVINALRSKLSWLQVMYYNGILYGKNGQLFQAGTVEGVVAQTEALVDGFRIKDGSTFQGLKQEQVVIGLPAADGAGGGYMKPASVISALNTLKGKYPNLGGIMGWSANYDSSSGYDFANKIGPYLGIKKINRPPALKLITDQKTVVGKLLSFSVTATDPDKDALKFSIFNNPTGSTFDNGSGAFSWTPGQDGIFPNIVIKVEDNASPALSDSQSITITVDKSTAIESVPGVQKGWKNGLITVGPNPADMRGDSKVKFIYTGEQTVSIAGYIFDGTGIVVFSRSFSSVSTNETFFTWEPKRSAGVYRALFTIENRQSGFIREVRLNIGIKR